MWPSGLKHAGPDYLHSQDVKKTPDQTVVSPTKGDAGSNSVGGYIFFIKLSRLTRTSRRKKLFIKRGDFS